MSTEQDDVDIELVPVPMDRETRQRLVKFAAAIDKQPIHAAAQLLRDLLSDDEFYEAAEAAAADAALH
jgi:2-keto-4-pentenoate hydratase